VHFVYALVWSLPLKEQREEAIAALSNTPLVTLNQLDEVPRFQALIQVRESIFSVIVLEFLYYLFKFFLHLF
jgi:hypothetical protein